MLKAGPEWGLSGLLRKNKSPRFGVFNLPQKTAQHRKLELGYTVYAMIRLGSCVVYIQLSEFLIFRSYYNKILPIMIKLPY